MITHVEERRFTNAEGDGVVARLEFDSADGSGSLRYRLALSESLLRYNLAVSKRLGAPVEVDLIPYKEVDLSREEALAFAGMLACFPEEHGLAAPSTPGAAAREKYGDPGPDEEDWDGQPRYRAAVPTAEEEERRDLRRLLGWLRVPSVTGLAELEGLSTLAAVARVRDFVLGHPPRERPYASASLVEVVDRALSREPKQE